MTRSELFTVMTAYLATIAGSVMVAYANFGAEPGHLMAASLMGAPAAIVISKLMLPEREVPDTANKDIAPDEERAHNIFDAASQGASLGLMMALHVGAMLIVAIGMIHILDMIATGVTGVSLTILLGWLFRPFAFIMGVPWADIPEVARLLAVKTFFNEFVAYGDLQKLIADKTISPRAITISTYALCGFANPGSLGIMIGALTAMAPDRRADVAGLALRALIGGTLATFMTACIAGVLVGT
jgi:CNT family concentrative nucleoside transporter